MSEASFARELGIEPANLKSISQIERTLNNMLPAKQAKAIYAIKLRDQNIDYVASQMKSTTTQVNLFVANGMRKLKGGNRHLSFVRSQIKHGASQKSSS